MVIKNYKELCCLLEIEPTTSNSKKAQMKELSRFCSSHKEGQKIIIDEIYEIPLPPVENKRNTGNFKKYGQLDIPTEKQNNGGVYMIQLYNRVYIGSTINFRQRFMQHLYNQNNIMPHTQTLLKKGGKMTILHDMGNVEDKPLLRMVEYEYIKYFRDNSGFIMVNGNVDPISFDKYYKINKREKQKYVKFKVREEDWEEVVLLLKERGIEIC